jgi:hypothetical protein
MKITTKIKIYTILSWILIGLTLLLAIVDQLKSGVFNPLGFITEILLQPYFWIALILRWRIKENKDEKQTKKLLYKITPGLLLLLGYVFLISGLTEKIIFVASLGAILAIAGSIWLVVISMTK